MRRGLVPATIGLGLGLAGAIAAGLSLSSLLFAVQPTDPMTLGFVAMVLAATMALACFLPARRVLKIDPIASLRRD
jgi:ABC-type antimicrobial peptide transport system permease subunit